MNWYEVPIPLLDRQHVTQNNLLLYGDWLYWTSLCAYRVLANTFLRRAEFNHSIAIHLLHLVLF